MLVPCAPKDSPSNTDPSAKTSQAFLSCSIAISISPLRTGKLSTFPVLRSKKQEAFPFEFYTGGQTARVLIDYLLNLRLPGLTSGTPALHKGHSASS